MPVLIPITDCDEDTYLDIANAKHGRRRRRLISAWPTIDSRYKHYIASTANLETLTSSPLSDIRKRDCRHCYDKPTKARDELVAKLLRLFPAHGLPICQYCLIHDVGTVDHYAPISTFPEFSVLPRNLVPACGVCNTLKKEKWLRDGVREVFSLYYEDMPAARYLEVDIEFKSVGGARISFAINRPAGLAEAVFRRIQRHYTIFDLIERYNTTAIRTVTGALISARILTSSGRATVQKYLERVADEWERQLGNNYWKAIAYRALANSNDFLALAGV